MTLDEMIKVGASVIGLLLVAALIVTVAVAVMQGNITRAVATMRDANNNTALKDAVEVIGKSVPESTVNALITLTSTMAQMVQVTNNPNAAEFKELAGEVTRFARSVTDGKPNAAEPLVVTDGRLRDPKPYPLDLVPEPPLNPGEVPRDDPRNPVS